MHIWRGTSTVLVHVNGISVYNYIGTNEDD